MTSVTKIINALCDLKKCRKDLPFRPLRMAMLHAPIDALMLRAKSFHMHCEMFIKLIGDIFVCIGG